MKKRRERNTNLGSRNYPASDSAMVIPRDGMYQGYMKAISVGLAPGQIFKGGGGFPPSVRAVFFHLKYACRERVGNHRNLMAWGAEREDWREESKQEERRKECRKEKKKGQNEDEEEMTG